MESYLIKYDKTVSTPELDWEGDNWKNVPFLKIDNYRKEGTDHKPETYVKALYNDNGIFLIYKVYDKYVKAVNNEVQGPVYQDSCVEFFVKPKEDKGYFNFEFNCIGNLLAGYKKGIVDGKRETTRLSISETDQIKITSTFKEKILEEIEEPTLWYLSVNIPFSILENHVGKLDITDKKKWRANFYKCGDKTSHPHWVSWSPVTELNFHLPECFGQINFE